MIIINNFVFCVLFTLFPEILEQRGAKPLLDLLVELGGWPMITPDWDRSQFDWLWLIAHLRLFNNDILISEWVGPDIKNSDEYVIHVSGLLRHL